jgi:hypothetical protein
LERKKPLRHEGNTKSKKATELTEGTDKAFFNSGFIDNPKSKIENPKSSLGVLRALGG